MQNDKQFVEPLVKTIIYEYTKPCVTDPKWEE